MSAKLIRLDKLITDRKLAPSRTAAQLLIEEGRVKVDGAVAAAASHEIGKLHSVRSEREKLVALDKFQSVRTEIAYLFHYITNIPSRLRYFCILSSP